MRTLKLWYYEPAQIVVVYFLARKESDLSESTHAVLFSQICGLQVIQCCKIIFIRISLNNSQMSLRFGSIVKSWRGFVKGSKFNSKWTKYLPIKNGN